MSKSSARSAIRLRGVRHNNLKNFDLDLPLNQLIVITGLSGSGKSSLAFDTLFAEGQRRYIETFSPYARQFLDRMDKPQVDSIEGIPPAIAIEQRNSVRTTRSTVGTMTEICDYMKLLWPHVAQLHCRQCGKPVRKDSPRQIWQECGMQSAQANGSGAGTAREPATNSDELLVSFDVPLTDKLSLAESLALVAKQGYQRVLISGKVVRISEAAASLAPSGKLDKHDPRLNYLTVVQDRLKLSASSRPRFIEACEQAYHFGKGKLTVHRIGPEGALNEHGRQFSNRLHCAQCDLEYREPSPALFSFNHPVGACPDCRGFGRIISIDYNLALPDRSKTLAQGVVKPWQSGQSAECQSDLLRMCRHFGVPTHVPFEKLAKKWQDFVIEGEPGYGVDEEHEWPRAWYGIKGYFRWLESKAYKMHVRVLLSRYRAYTPCPACGGMRLQPDALLYRVALPQFTNGDRPAAVPASVGPRSLTLPDFYQLPIRQAVVIVEQLESIRPSNANDPLRLALTEVRARLGYLNDVGLGYLTLDRPTRSLSGGETERVSLTTCLGTRLVNTLFVLDEPSVGLHARDTQRLIRILEQLRDAGNTVVIVEHEASVMRAADQLVDLGPGHGAAGGQVVFQGNYSHILDCPKSLTGQYLSGRKVIPIPARRSTMGRNAESAASRSASWARPGLRETGSGSLCESLDRRTKQVEVLRRKLFRAESRARSNLVLNEVATPYSVRPDEARLLRLTGVTLHNLRNLSVQIPLERFVCLTGVSGSGKTTLVREVLLPALSAKLKSDLPTARASDRQDQAEEPGAQEDPERAGARYERLDGSEHLNQVVLVDQAVLGKTPRSNPAVYIGAFEDIRELYAQSDLARRRGLNASAFSFNSSQGQCERCRGAGFEKIEMQFLSDVYVRCPDCDGRRYRAHILEIKVGGLTPGQPHFSIADLLDSTVDEVIAFLKGLPESRAGARAARKLTLLQETGLGYLKLGQPINTLSGGECQRLKLVKHLAESLLGEAERPGGNHVHPTTGNPASRILFLFDEPTTGLHFDDVRVLLKVFQRLVDAGHSLLVIEHNLDVIKCADWVIDLGPEAGELGGQIVAEGTPEQVSQCQESHTGRALQPLLGAAQSRSESQNRAFKQACMS